MDIKGLRKDYRNPVLSRETLAADPFDQFEDWFHEACAAGLPEPNAMVLSTVGADGQPTLRTVLLKLFDRNGFVFFTNYGSRKAVQISENSQVALLFPWIQQARQVTVTGTAAKISVAESAQYFATRPRNSQLGAWISRQSSILSSRRLLMMELEQMKNKFLQGKIPLPDFWGGYRVQPTSIEFWQGQTSRLHDRFLYTREEEGWRIERLAP
ncbi:pyridoxamine 5'-phosphate oxidase [Desulfobulbus oligotrophicus]|jgi:pyridoxamine 5'-phosphate oxidase|uniref:Pyridoxamine 5'-phosphate oxidase n=1 Tax=Desulfobulbus oligotrophicus TaxID=1909699 RepID=A0A7T5VDK7_9BACT|nr:pyridoxamine 5'-phosphate oxidase [Desulfobulbus oligotrophicus]MDY0389414.1 pyridoxamine 5'-phosphate oxidase [Desulfobulbus oligotrophicus]QQG65944.1 pyridoxamine 5'-phosphate oxidase [Desulfobulbus oligotrophicus]